MVNLGDAGSYGCEGDKMKAGPRRDRARIVGDVGGATAIEYALIGALISIVIVAALTAVGVDVKALFGKVTDGFN